MNLIEKIASRDASVGIIGLGYVGLPLAVAFAEAGFQVIGIDLDEREVQAVSRHDSYIEDVPSETLQRLGDSISATTDFSALDEAAIQTLVPVIL